MTLTNLSGSDAAYAVAVEPGDGGVACSIAPASLTLGAGASGTVVITMSAQKGAAGGEHQAKLSVIADRAEIAHAAVYMFIR